MIKMYIVLGIVILIYIWRIFNGSRNGLIDEVGALADIVIVSAMVVAGMILTWYLILQSDITNSIKRIASLESQLNEMKRENDENYNRITSNIDLEEVKRVAIQELGMRYAEEGQIITFNGEGSDYIRQTGDIPE